MTFMKGQSGNPTGMKPGTRNKRNLVVDAIGRKWGNSHKFWDKICDAAYDGDAQAMNILVARHVPPLKAQSLPIQLPDITGNTSTAEAVPIVVRAIAEGAIPVDDGSALLSALLAGSKLEKLDALEQRVNELLENQHGQR